MKKHRAPRHLGLAGVLALISVVFGCITINLNFPEQEIRETAEEIVDDVRPSEVVLEDDAEPTDSDAAAAEDQETSWLTFFVSTAHAAPAQKRKINVDALTPLVKSIQASLKARYKKLLAFYKLGAVGEDRKGFLVLRQLEKLSLKQKRDVKGLVKAENKDRLNLYRELARVNGLAEKQVAEIGKVFATQWQAKCHPGWWIEKKKWERKKGKPKPAKPAS